jgi:hypothetical protein
MLASFTVAEPAADVKASFESLDPAVAQDWLCNAVVLRESVPEPKSLLF